MTSLSPYPRRWWALGALALTLLVIGLDLTVLSVALPSLAADLHASTGDLQWFSNAYTLVLAALLLPAGSLGDRLGQKRLMLGALAWFGLASVACAYATASGELIAARAALGVGAAFLMPLSISLLNILFPAAERAKALTVWVLANSLGIPLGPLVGGWLLDHFWWGSVFLVNVPMIGLAMLAVAFLVPHRAGGQAATRIDVAGVVLSSAGLVAVTSGFVRFGEKGWGDTASWVLVGAGLAVLAAFGRWQGRTRTPLADLDLFRTPEFTWGAVIATLAQFAMMGLFFVLPLLFQAVQGAGSLGAGLRLLPVIAGLMVGAKVAERVTAKAGVKPTIAFGFAVGVAGLALGATTGSGDGYGFVVWWEALAGLSMGFVLPPALTMATGALKAGREGAGSALLQALRQIGGTIGVTVLGTVLNSGYRAKLTVGDLPAPAADAARGGVSQAVAVAGRLHSPALAGSARGAFLHGMAGMLWTAAGVFVAGLVLSLLVLPRHTARSGGQRSQSEHDAVPL